ncbi:MAG: hypothetical protein ACI9SX_000880 [Pseudoalteromonas tetraodonis]|jgi:hypothetical protein
MAKLARTNLARFMFVLFATSSSCNVLAHETMYTTLDLQFTHYDRDYTKPQNDRVQTALSAALAHSRSIANDLIQIGGALYAVKEVSSSGRIVTDILALSDNELSGFALVGEAYVKFKPSESLSFQIGRIEHKSLLLQSKTRAVASTFEGIGFDFSLNKYVQIYAHRFYRWSARASNKFAGFGTNVSEDNAIPYVEIIGLKFDNYDDKNWSANANIEYLESKNYLRKLGLVTSVERSLKASHKLELSGGIFFSRDAGELFTNGANDGLDYSTTPSDERQQHRGFGGYLALSYSQHNWSFGITRSFIDDPWLEDSFADDHGTTPLPTKTYGPELTNNNERIWKLEYTHNFAQSWARGLRSKFSWARGAGAQNSIDAELGTGTESWFELDLQYSPKVIDELQARLRYRNYESDLTGQIAGIKDDRNELRFTIAYSIDF